VWVGTLARAQARKTLLTYVPVALTCVPTSPTSDPLCTWGPRYPLGSRAPGTMLRGDSCRPLPPPPARCYTHLKTLKSLTWRQPEIPVPHPGPLPNAPPAKPERVPEKPEHPCPTSGLALPVKPERGPEKPERPCPTCGLTLPAKPERVPEKPERACPTCGLALPVKPERGPKKPERPCPTCGSTLKTPFGKIRTHSAEIRTGLSYTRVDFSSADLP